MRSCRQQVLRARNQHGKQRLLPCHPVWWKTTCKWLGVAWGLPTGWILQPLVISWTFLWTSINNKDGRKEKKQRKRQWKWKMTSEVNSEFPMIPLNTKVHPIYKLLIHSLPSLFSDPHFCTRPLIVPAAERYGWPTLNVLLQRKVYIPLKCHSHKAENPFERCPAGQRLLQS